MMENGKMIWEMVMECFNGLMAINMKENGKIIRHLDKEKL